MQRCKEAKACVNKGCIVTEKDNSLIGKKFNRLTVIEIDDNYIDRNGRRRPMTHCICECGNDIWARKYDVMSGRCHSCGCYQKEAASKARKKRAALSACESKERIHNIWYLMIDRCTNEKSHAFRNYGARGITVCDEWLDKEEGYHNFKQWAISNGYSDNLSLDRSDNSKGYNPGNCRWVDSIAQANNKRNNVIYTIYGETMTLAEASRKYGVRYKTLWNRVHNLGWDIYDAISR